VREFIRILKLHREYPADLVAQAVTQALEYSCAHADGVRLCLNQLMESEMSVSPIDLANRPELVAIGTQVPDLHCYDQLLVGV
jgi:hypothetical protein